MSKRVNISIPAADQHYWEMFKKQCKKNKKSVSKELVKFMKSDVRVKSPELPDWLN